MFSKYIVPAIAATNLLNGVEGSSRHRHLHKKDVVYAATEVDVTTVWETVTVTAGDETPAATPSAANFVAAAAPDSSYEASSVATTATSSSEAVIVAPTTYSTPSTTTLSTVQTSAAAPETSSTSTYVAVTTTAAASTTSTAAASTTSAASTGSSSSSGTKRGLGYNDASLVSTIVSAASASFGWCYDWGFTNGGLTANINYIPMLWGPTHYDSSWSEAASAAVSDGVEALLSFNECDNAGQANLDAATAATYHTEYFSEYQGKIKIGAPSITSSADAGLGLDWLASFMSACGSSCPIDFVNLHWYGPGGEEGAQTFLDYLVEAYTQTNYPVWVTEFGVTSGDEDTFLTYALDQLDNNSTYSFVDKYAYFYLATGYLMESTTSLSTAGSIYASSS
ncbi:hypothetical protein PFICI_15011 [Pestalotiopsis fici W106-1]|uniref:Asl1-like glycosyl hydrolase catalytic domain-containing protein n=1 Tax=Pestalotiopsis fici (strain W106-1 / CGMCC3.15140) TaxID=1229662 RepID=W3WKQ7_PESFW|nr:uncharacterized protein PFICI_15011 [Pestalotiopsis fici W106-1]ETS73406.1 hypothetical protein PFICI_15011 [Pestalotiopsis fici W106-1]